MLWFRFFFRTAETNLLIRWEMFQIMKKNTVALNNFDEWEKNTMKKKKLRLK